MHTAAPTAAATPGWRLAVIGAGPAGLALALQAARLLPRAEITVFDARPADQDVAGDPRTLALALGSVLALQKLGAWPAAQAQPITEVLVSQAPPTLSPAWGGGAVRLRASDEAVPMLGAVLSYGALVACLQQAWQAAQGREPQRLRSRFGQAVVDVRNLAANADPKGAPGGQVQVDAGIVEGFDLAVVAEGSVFADRARKAVSHDYHQTAWVGSVTLAGATPGLAVERFTRDGPLALLPLLPLLPPSPLSPLSPLPPLSPLRPPSQGGGGQASADGLARAALVWCVNSGDDPVAPLNQAQRIAVLASLLPPEAGRVVGLSPLKNFALSLNAERTLVDGAIVRIGNAAQTLHPVAGQGLNLGLRDATELVLALRRAQPAELPALLRRLEWARGPDRWAMIAATDFLARSFTWRWPGLAAARGLGLAALQALPPLKSALARRMMFGRR